MSKVDSLSWKHCTRRVASYPGLPLCFYNGKVKGEELKLNFPVIKTERKAWVRGYRAGV